MGAAVAVYGGWVMKLYVRYASQLAALVLVGCGGDGGVATGTATGTDATGTGGTTCDSSADCASSSSGGVTPTTGDPSSTSGSGGGSSSTGSSTGDPSSTGSSTGDPSSTGSSSSGDSSSGTTGVVCPVGTEGCPCGPADECDALLTCVGGTCIVPPVECGDGVVNGDDVCDDGNPDNTDDCLDTCKPAACGDGFVHADIESCDDGNLDNTDSCVGACVDAKCGDGFVQVGVEVCDDGNLDDTDDCVGVCVAAKCGDGFVHAGIEACDDGNAVDNDKCTNACTVPVGTKDALVVASTSTGVVSVLDPANFTVLVSYPGFSSPQSVAPGPDGKLYVGQNGNIRTVDIKTKAAVDIGAGVVSGNLYGITVRVDKIYASGSGMGSVKVLSLAGADAGQVASPNGSNLRSTAFGPQGDFYLSSFGGGPGQRWSPGLVYVGAFGGGGLVNGFGTTTRASGDVLIADQNQAAYYVFSQQGVFKKKVAVNCVGQLRNIAADSQGRVYIGCYEANKVVQFDAADLALKEIPIASPAGVAVLANYP